MATDYVPSQKSSEIIEYYWPESLGKKRTPSKMDFILMQIELIHHHYPNMDAASQARAVKTLSYLKQRHQL